MVREAQYRAVGRLAWGLLTDKVHMSDLDSSDKGALKRVGYETTLLALLNFILLPMLITGADEDKDDWWLNFLALLATKSVAEQTNLYNPMDLYRTVNSVSSLFDIINPFIQIVSVRTIKDLFSGDELIRYGAYKRMTKTERALIKMTPFKNLFELKDPRLKRKYYQQMYDND
ncbi:MAG: hypothetical protein EOM41_11730 [Bacilli bacterium]|nr:hypothetical protein [Bacilli bacterium]